MTILTNLPHLSDRYLTQIQDPFVTLTGHFPEHPNKVLYLGAYAILAIDQYDEDLVIQGYQAHGVFNYLGHMLDRFSIEVDPQELYLSLLEYTGIEPDPTIGTCDQLIPLPIPTLIKAIELYLSDKMSQDDLVQAMRVLCDYYDLSYPLTTTTKQE